MLGAHCFRDTVKMAVNFGDLEFSNGPAFGSRRTPHAARRYRPRTIPYLARIASTRRLTFNTRKTIHATRSPNNNRTTFVYGDGDICLKRTPAGGRTVTQTKAAITPYNTRFFFNSHPFLFITSRPHPIFDANILQRHRGNSISSDVFSKIEVLFPNGSYRRPEMAAPCPKLNIVKINWFFVNDFQENLKRNTY